MGLKWHGNEIEAALKKICKANLTRACIYLANAVKQNISESSNKGETPSEPGEPPHKDTGRLRSSISYEVDEQNLKGYVGTNVVYGKFLELGTQKMAARPYLRPTMAQESNAIKDILGKGGK